MVISRLLIVALFIVSVELTSKASGAPLIMRYEPYPPFVWGEEDNVQGEFAAYTQKVGAAASLELVWHKGTYKRIMRDLYDNAGNFCVTGYSFSENRAHLVQYTVPYGRFPPSGIAVRQEDLPMFKYHAHIFDVLADPTISGIFIEGAKYGEDFNRRVASGTGRHLHISGGDEDLVYLLAKGRGHFAMVNGAQVNHFRSRIPGAESLKVLQPEGMSKGSAVHMVCTLNVPERIVTQLNAGIRSVGALPSSED